MTMANDPIALDVARLVQVLAGEEEVYFRLRKLLQQEESEMIGLDPRTMSEIVEQKRLLAEEARLLEDSRSVVTRELAQRLGLAPKGTKLSQIISALGPQAGELPALHARLSALMQSNRSLIAANEQFANRTLGRIQDTLKMLGQSISAAPGYGPGQPNSSSGRGRLVKQAI